MTECLPCSRNLHMLIFVTGLMSVTQLCIRHSSSLQLQFSIYNDTPQVDSPQAAAKHHTISFYRSAETARNQCLHNRISQNLKVSSIHSHSCSTSATRRVPVGPKGPRGAPTPLRELLGFNSHCMLRFSGPQARLAQLQWLEKQNRLFR